MNIRKLKYPIWEQIIFYALTLVAPVVLLVVQGLTSPHKVFRISFTFVCTLLLTWIFIKKFLIAPYLKRLKDEKSILEHDYAIDVGNTDKSRYMWYTNELRLFIVNIIDVGLFGSVILLLVAGVKNMTFNVQGSSFMVIIFYFIAFTVRVIYLLVKRAKSDKIIV